MIWRDVQQNSDEWLELRRGKVTASNFSMFMANDGKSFGEPAKKYALQVALERVTGIKSEGGFSNCHTDRGHIEEPIARLLYEETYFTEVTNGGLFDCGEYADSPDGLAGNDGVIEIKSVTPSVHYATLKRGSFDPAYTWQLVGHIECSNRSWVDFVSYCSEFPRHNNLIVFRTYREEFSDHIKRLQARRTEFLKLINQLTIEINNINSSL